MTLKEVRDYIASLASMLYFKCDGKDGHIDPYTSDSILLFYDGVAKTVNSVDAAMNEPFINGKSITQAFPNLTDIEY